MGGVAGVVSWRSGEIVEPARLQNMVGCLAHQGADELELVCEGGAGMGTWRRPKVAEPTPPGGRPWSSDDGAVTAVLDGALHDHLDLRSRLLAEGQAFRGTSDTETLVHGYRRQGIDKLLGSVSGVFALAVLDRPHRKLVLARDGCGVKPLYLRRAPGQISFASEIRAFTHDGIGRPSVDPAFLGSFLNLGCVLSPATAFAGIAKLDPGTVLEIDLETGAEESRVFHRLLPEPLDPHLGPRDLLALLRQRLNWVVRRQSLCDSSMGAWLTGGPDSAAVLAFAAPHRDRAPASFSIASGLETKELGTSAASIVARSVGSSHTVVTLDPATLTESLAAIQAAVEEPLADVATFPLWHLCRRTSAHVEVVLSAEGGAQALAGLLRPATSSASSVASSLLAPLFDAGARQRLAGVTTDVVAPRLQALDERARADGLDVTQCLRRLEISTVLLDKQLVSADKLSRAQGLEIRMPLLDRKLLELGLSLPIGAGIAPGHDQTLLTRLLAERLPRAVPRGPEQGFAWPVASWFRDPFTASLRQRLSSGALARGLGMSAPGLRDIVARHLSGEDLGRQIFALAALEAWAEHHG